MICLLSGINMNKKNYKQTGNIAIHTNLYYSPVEKTMIVLSKIPRLSNSLVKFPIPSSIQVTIPGKKIMHTISKIDQNNKNNMLVV